MDKKKKITAEEKAEFAHAMKNIFNSSSPSKITVPKPEKIESNFFPIELQYLPDNEWVNSDDIISYHRSGLQLNLLKKIMQGKIPIEKRLDLHGMIVRDAITETKIFLEKCQQQQIRFALIVHGKSHKGKPVLKNALNIWLRTQPTILAFHSALAKHGGGGALYILIKRNNL